MLRLFRGAIQGAHGPRLPGGSEVFSGKRPGDIPSHRIKPLSSAGVARFTGPELGLRGVHENDDERSSCKCCQKDWTVHLEGAFGIAVSLYDVANRESQLYSGDPVADVFGIVSYRNGALLSVADGVNWGLKSRLAARCAVHGSLEYLEDALGKASSTQEVIAYILRSFDSAQKLIIKKQATMTTLCTACLFQLESGRWGLCSVNVGDSLLYIYSPEQAHVREVTEASHGVRLDMREAGGALGPSDGYNPDLSNLTCSFTFLQEGDIVFGTTDGISDNFDPLVLDRAAAAAGRGAKGSRTRPSPSDKKQHAEAVLRRMGEVLSAEMPWGKTEHARDLAISLLKYSVNQTDAKRRCLEEANDARDDPKKEQELVSQSQSLPGKLDHAAVAAVDVCIQSVPLSPEDVERRQMLAQELKHF